MPTVKVNSADITNAAITENIAAHDPVIASALSEVSLADSRAIADTILANAAYVNAYIGDLFYLYGDPLVAHMYYENHFKELKSPMLRYGQGEIEYFVEGSPGADFDASGAGLLTPTTDTIEHWVYQVKSFRTFETTIYEDDLRMAFLNEGGVYNFVASKMGAMYSQIELEEYKKISDLLKSPVIGGTAADGTIVLPYITYTAGDSTDLMKKIRAMAMTMQFPTSYESFMPKYGAAGTQVENCVRPEDLMIISNPQMIADVDVDLLATAFHQDKTDWMFKVLTMDTIPAPATTISATVNQTDAILFHRNLFKIQDTKFKTSTFYNADNDAYKVYVHKNTIYALRPFYPAVAVCTKV